MSAHGSTLPRRYRAAIRSIVDKPRIHCYQIHTRDNYRTNSMELTITSAERCALEKTTESFLFFRDAAPQSAHAVAAVIVSSTG